MTSRRLPRSHHLAIRLHSEWRRLDSRPHVVATVNGWGLSFGPVACLDDVLRAVGYGWAGDDRSDGALRELVRLAAHDHLAARIVLQRILPGLGSVARRRGDGNPARAATAFDELVGWAWQLIRTYPIERRPRWLAANLVRDAQYQAFTRPARLRRHPTSRFDEVDTLPAGNTAEEPMFELVGFLSDARARGADAGDIELIARLATAASVGDVAAQQGVTDRTIRSRRAAAIERLRRAAA